MKYSPPFQLTHTMMGLVADISELIGLWTASNANRLVPKLRRENRIKTIQASLAVEQNTLSIEQVTAVIEGKTVLGTPKEIQEVHNAFAAYEAMENWNPLEAEDLLSAHNILMTGLVTNAGSWRTDGTGIYRGTELVHMAPPAGQVPRLMYQLIDWLSETEAHPLIASAAFHYEFEFIHPFSDGNGRMGRLWQTLILSHWQPLLAFLPVETVIREKQQDYYHWLSHADAQSDSTKFIEFLLSAIKEALNEAIEIDQSSSKTLAKTQDQTLVKTKEKTPDKILRILKSHPDMNLSEVAYNINRSVSAVERAVAKLKKENRLSYHGPKKNGHWKVH
ncbi:Fic family protein [Shewanella sp. 202IG2-18]|uniref:Fic family protein n=1 Tax=Parashewanella hymeniacidonis TaxID=2807618 RepID=UPI001960A562|nr:Fic family protein [Parashewanella hymeniacidonis]MBM7073763.1 Fic family protein [Parashewanella hymeniacidonis]